VTSGWKGICLYSGVRKGMSGKGIAEIGTDALDAAHSQGFVHRAIRRQASL